jgi:leucyl-tRNA synthetase
MDKVLATKRTGVVTSVPSDSPDDCDTLMDLRKKADFYKIDPAWAAIDPVPVISTLAYGEMTAPALVKQLAEVKQIAYQEGFCNGTARWRLQGRVSSGCHDQGWSRVRLC